MLDGITERLIKKPQMNYSEGIKRAFKLCKQTPTTISLTDDETVYLVSKNNKIVYNNCNISIATGDELKISKETMFSYVYSFLSEAGVISGDNYTVSCVPIVSKTLNMNNEYPTSETTVVGYNYVFSQKDVLSVSERADSHNTVSVICTNEGISSFASYNADINTAENTIKEVQN